MELYLPVFLLFVLGSGSATVCPDHNTCPDLATCCRIYTGGYGCCPFMNADCCPDLIHCCKEGYSCSTGRCVPRSLPFAAIAPSPNTLCPDSSECPGDYTCCLAPTGEYGCCPYAHGTCCSDGLHCCPKGTNCNVAEQTCEAEDNTKVRRHRLSSSKMSSRDHSVESNEVGDVDCGDEASCPDGSTCCKLPNMKWGCCPLPNAQCCDDHIHCCPSGTTCTAGSCEHAPISQPWAKQVPSSSVLKEAELTSVVCPGGEFQCPDNNTCCRLSSGQWGCCPMPNATCCADGLHCCPHGNTCSGGRCYSKSSLSVPWSEKFKATPRPKRSIIY